MTGNDDPLLLLIGTGKQDFREYLLEIGRAHV